MKHINLILSLIAIASSCICGCSQQKVDLFGDDGDLYDNQSETLSTFSFDDGSGDTYDETVFFRNDLKINASDPSVLYVSKEQDPVNGGYFYMTATSPLLQYHAFELYRSADLVNWTDCGPAFVPDINSWTFRDIWAPDIQYVNGLYLIYYAGGNYSSGVREMNIGVAASTSPLGPYTEYVGYNYDKSIYFDGKTPVFDFDVDTIDPNLFIDDDGKMYLYFSLDRFPGASTVYGVELLDPFTVKPGSEPTRIIYPGSESNLVIDDNPNISSWECVSPEAQRGTIWNEAPYMIKHNGKYIMTYTANPYWDQRYNVGYAVGDSPLGEFNKPCSLKYENMLLGKDPDDTSSTYWDFMAGPGHQCIFKAGDDWMIGYHAHNVRDGTNGYGGRRFAIDRMYFDNDDVPFVNGPTYSLQPLPELCSGYKNLAIDATISGNENNLLNDNRFPMHMCRNEELAREVSFEGKTTISIDLNDKHDVKALMIYGSMEYEKALFHISQIDFGNNNLIYKLPLAERYIDTKYDYVRPGAPFVANFKEINTNKITITIDTAKEFSISEIVVLGK